MLYVCVTCRIARSSFIYAPIGSILSWEALVAWICGYLLGLRGAPGVPRLSSGGGEDEHSLQIPRHGHEAPLAAHFIESAQ